MVNDELNILLVEDDSDARAALRDILEIDDHRVAEVGTAGEARKFVSTHPVDVVILDRRLPDGSAEVLLPELRDQCGELDVIVATGYADMDAALTALRFGVTDYIIKPIHPDLLRGALKRILKRRQIEAELKREHDFTNLIIRTAEAIVLVLDLEGKIVRFNPYFERTTGWKLKQLKGLDWFDNCIPEADRHWVREVFRDTAENDVTSGVINPVLTNTGHTRQIRWSNTTLKDESGAVPAVLSIGVDVTDLLLAQERALQSQRLAAIGQTMTALAHESRNALQRIQAGLEMLSLELPTESDAVRDLQSIDRATRDLHSLLEEVRSYAAPVRLHLERTDLLECCQRVWKQLTETNGDRDAQLLLPKQTDSMPRPRVDVLRFEQILRNLFENSLAACADPCRVMVGFEWNEDAVVLRICDNGPGLNAEQRSRLFEPFFTTKTSGTGLGMAIVARLVQAHGGRIVVVEQALKSPPSMLLPEQAIPCDGAVFDIEFPIHGKPSYDAQRTA